MLRPVVAIVGRPNVGKSALFNRLVGKKISIVDDKSGITRDRVYGQCEWGSRKFTLVDTGGLGFAEDEIDFEVRKQTEFALSTSDVIVFVVDSKVGLLPLDKKIFLELQRSSKPILVCVNKCDNANENLVVCSEFYALGTEQLFAVSAAHGFGTGDLLDAVCENFPSKEEIVDSSGDKINVALIGRPNVGKSTLLNKICGENRSVVSTIAGTTRDSVDVEV